MYKGPDFMDKQLNGDRNSFNPETKQEAIEHIELRKREDFTQLIDGIDRATDIEQIANLIVEKLTPIQRFQKDMHGPRYKAKETELAYATAVNRMRILLIEEVNRIRGA